MEPSAPAEELPALYRAILDRVAALEAAGHRDEGLRVRQAATKAYSRAWDDRARRQLTDLLRRAQRPTASERADAARSRERDRTRRSGSKPHPRRAVARDR